MKKIFTAIGVCLPTTTYSQDSHKLHETGVSDYPFFGTNDDILFSKTYHGDEIDVYSLQHKQWLSLQETSLPNIYFLKHDSPQMEYVKDPILDDENSTTAIKIESSYEGLFLFTNEQIFGTTAEGYEGYEVEKVKVPEILELNQPHQFDLKNKKYILTAGGTIGQNGLIENYKLTLTMEKNDKIITQILIYQSNPNNEKVNILFAGDIDNDGILDLVIDTSDHYNVQIPKLSL